MALRADVERFSPVTEAAILNGICCPPQDPFKLSAQEPLLKAQKEEGDEVQRPKECWRASLAIVLCRGFMSSEFESELQERTKVGSFGHHLLYLDRRSFLTISIKYIYWLSHETLLDFIIYFLEAAPINMLLSSLKSMENYHPAAVLISAECFSFFRFCFGFMALIQCTSVSSHSRQLFTAQRLWQTHCTLPALRQYKGPS